MKFQRIIAALTVSFAVLANMPAIHAGNPFGGLGDLISGLTAKNDFDLKELAGTWVYSSPAVTFKSDNSLNRIGGVAASAAVEAKLAPYYQRLGLTSAVVTIDSEQNFTIKIKAVTLTGTITRDDDSGSITFNFSAKGKINLGKVSAMATKSANNVLTLTFDASRVITVVEKVATFTKNSSVTALSKLLSSYEGVYAGAKLKKQQ